MVSRHPCALTSLRTEELSDLKYLGLFTSLPGCFAACASRKTEGTTVTPKVNKLKLSFVGQGLEGRGVLVLFGALLYVTCLKNRLTN